MPELLFKFQTGSTTDLERATILTNAQANNVRKFSGLASDERLLPIDSGATINYARKIVSFTYDDDESHILTIQYESALSINETTKQERLKKIQETAYLMSSLVQGNLWYAQGLGARGNPNPNSRPYLNQDQAIRATYRWILHLARGAEWVVSDSTYDDAKKRAWLEAYYVCAGYNASAKESIVKTWYKAMLSSSSLRDAWNGYGTDNADGVYVDISDADGSNPKAAPSGSGLILTGATFTDNWDIERIYDLRKPVDNYE